MISGDEYILLVKTYFKFLEKEFNYREKNITKRSSLFYDVEYQRDNIIISISYENREEYLQVIMFKTKNGVLPNYDDKESTIHLEVLNSKILKHLTSEDFKENDRAFSAGLTSDKIENVLLKSAKELRLCLKNIGIVETIYKE